MNGNVQEQNLTQSRFNNGEIREPVIDVISTITACLAVLGNGLVITVMLAKRRRFNSFTNRLILHQSVIDAITGVVFFLFNVIKTSQLQVSLNNTFWDQLICRFVYSDILLWCMYITSTYNLVSISLERFFATCYVFRHRNSMTTRKLKLVMGACWLIGFVYCALFSVVFQPHEGYCREVDTSPLVAILLVLSSWMTEYFLPIAIHIFAYTRILIALKGSRIGNAENPINIAKKNTLKIGLLVSTMYALLWTPAEVALIYNVVYPSEEFGSSIGYRVTTSLVACNMWVNPIIYCFMYEQFRYQLKDVIIKRFRGNRVHNVYPLYL